MRQYKQVIEQVKTTKAPAVVESQRQPQVALISLDDLEQLTQLHAHRGGQALLETAQRVRALLKDERLPADLATRHDHYLWDDGSTDDPKDARNDPGDDPDKQHLRQRTHQRTHQREQRHEL